MKIFGKKGFEGLLSDMYRDGRNLLLLKAAESYLESEYYDMARGLFQRAGRIDRNNRQAWFLHLYTSAFHFYYKNKFSRARQYAEKALEAAGGPHATPYRGALHDLIADLSRETKGLRKPAKGV